MQIDDIYLAIKKSEKDLKSELPAWRKAYYNQVFKQQLKPETFKELSVADKCYYCEITIDEIIAIIESVLGEKLINTVGEDEVIVKKKMVFYYSTIIKQFEIQFKKSDILKNQEKSVKSVDYIQITNDIVSKIETSKVASKSVKVGESNYALAA